MTTNQGVDAFYLRNKALYEKLVSQLDASAPKAHFSRQTASASAVAHNENEVRVHPNMTIAARIRPMLEDDFSEGYPCAAYPRDNNAVGSRIVDMHDLHNHHSGRPQLRSTKYKVDQVFDGNATTEEVYRSLVTDLVSFAKDGGLSTLFAYGQTGSGKTFTVSELQRLAIATLVNETSAASNEAELYLTVSDLAGNSAFDLLDSRKPVPVLEDAFGTTHLAGAKEYRIASYDEALDLLDQAASFRRTESTKHNDASSRSHINPTGEGVLYLIDLAGSEQARDVTQHGADRMRETREINVSLSALKDCLRGKAEIELARRAGRQKKIHLPMRRSVLTRVLKHVFDAEEERECKTVVIACVNPSLADVNASKNTLRYAEMLGNA